MALLWVLRLRRLQRLTKLFIVLLSIGFVSYFVFTFNNRPVEQVTSANVVFRNLSIEDRQTAIESTRGVYSRNVGLNVHVWRELCGSEAAYLKTTPFFPHYPDEKKIITEFETEDNGIDYGQMIFGFVHPQKSGLYRFAITSDDSSELWLSASEDPKEKQLIARVYSEDASAWTEKGDWKKYPEQISNHIELKAGNKYYIEAIHKQGVELGFVQVYWANSRPGSKFEIISSEYLSTFSADIVVSAKKDVLHALFLSPSKLRDGHETTLKKEYLEFYSLPLITEEKYLPSCIYKSSFVLEDTIYRYSGIHFVSESNVYPRDDTGMGYRGNIWSWPNRVADEQVIHSIIDKMLAPLRLKTSKKYVLKRIHKVLQKSDSVFGDRFSVDLELGLKSTNRSYRLSEHVYLKKDSGSLCSPEGFNWNSKATVYFILPVKRQGKWVYHFINQLSTASLLTGDTNFHVMVMDFDSRDIDMAKAFDTPLLRSRHTVVNMTGDFYKTLALNKGVELVPSPHDIVFLFDLHIDVPADILDSVRKNTIEGRIAYFPVVGRLECQSSQVDHRGFWQKDGYGILAVYKSDWIRFGGMNTADFKYKWGGEDWDLLDRVLNAKLEVERVKQPGLFHHYQSKQKNWN